MYRGIFLLAWGESLLKKSALVVLLLCMVFGGQFDLWAAMRDIQAMRSVEVLTFDESGGALRFPSGVSYDRDSDELYVTSPQASKLVVLTADYFPYLSIGSGRDLHSISKTFIKNGYLYVCVGISEAEMRPHIAVYDMAFMPVTKIYFPDYERFSPFDLVVADDGKIYVVGVNGTGVMVLDSEGNFIRWIEPKGRVLGIDEKAPIIALDIGVDGRIYMLSESMGRVFVYDRNERLLYQFGEKGGDAGKLSRPRGIAVDDVRGQVYLVDYQRHTMSVFSKRGDFLFEVGGMGAGRGWFYYPSDVVIDGRGRVVVADTFNHRVQVFEFISKKVLDSKETMVKLTLSPRRGFLRRWLKRLSGRKKLSVFDRSRTSCCWRKKGTLFCLLSLPKANGMPTLWECN